LKFLTKKVQASYHQNWTNSRYQHSDTFKYIVAAIFVLYMILGCLNNTKSYEMIPIKSQFYIMWVPKFALICCLTCKNTIKTSFSIISKFSKKKRMFFNGFVAFITIFVCFHQNNHHLVLYGEAQFWKNSWYQYSCTNRFSSRLYK